MNEEQLASEFERQNITLASFPRRIAAYFIDDFIMGVFFFFAFYDLFVSAVTFNDMVMVAVTTQSYVVIMKMIYQTFFVWMYGATPGKMLMKIKIIYVYTVDKPSFFTALLRSSGRVISESLFYIGFIWALFNQKRETWQDLIAKTLVVNA